MGQAKQSGLNPHSAHRFCSMKYYPNINFYVIIIQDPRYLQIKRWGQIFLQTKINNRTERRLIHCVCSSIKLSVIDYL